MATNEDSRTTGDDDKLLPEWGRPADEQIVWLALGILAIMGLIFFGVSRCGDQARDVAEDLGFVGVGAGLHTVGDFISGDDDLTYSAELFDQADIGSELVRDRGPFTVLAPTDTAWEELASVAEISVEDDILDGLSDEQADESASFHVIEGRHTLDELIEMGSVETIDGSELTFDKDGLINSVVEVVDSDFEASNGIVHKIAGLLPSMPIEPAQLADESPTSAPVPTATSVPTPEPTPTPVPTAPPEPEPEPEPRAEAFAGLLHGSQADLQSMAQWLGQAGTAGVLLDPDEGPFTIFAPTNGAFSSAQELLAGMSDADAAETINYHVVSGLIGGVDIVPGARFETLGGETLIVDSDGSLSGGVEVITQDLGDERGLLHVIDAVMVPVGVQLRGLNELFQLEPIQFDVGSATIRRESVPTLQTAANIIAGLPSGTEVVVEGHTDTDGDAESNLVLSRQRAQAVTNYLIGAGVAPGAVSAVGLGESSPLTPDEQTPEDKQSNRRIEFRSAN